MTSDSRPIAIALLALGLAGYALPWIVAPNGAMTLNAYDLAEWASLHPSQPGTNPPLLASLLLRGPLVALACILGLTAAGWRYRAGAAIAICLLVIAQLPPPEFVRDINNLNYRQQLGMALASGALGLAALRLNRERIAGALIIGLCLAGMAASAAGSAQAQALYDAVAIAAGAGSGLFVLCLSYAGLAGLCLWRLRARRRA